MLVPGRHPSLPCGAGWGRSGRRALAFVLCLGVSFSLAWGPPPAEGAAPASPAAEVTAIVVADPADPYAALAREIAAAEALPLIATLPQALARNPIFLLWVTSPQALSDEVLIAAGLALRDHGTAVSMGLLSGATLEQARALWLRAAEVQSDRVVAANAANPSGSIEAGITTWGADGAVREPLTAVNLADSLRSADYLTFTGHGGSSYLGLGEYRALRTANLPALGPTVIATGSCNTFRLWEEGSIALGFVAQGAAAYAGFAYSPLEGHLVGEFDGLPFRYTWPGVPVGHVVHLQNQGVQQGFARIPVYFLLGDPRIALQTEAPYRLVENQAWDGRLSLTYADAPAGFVPILVPGGATYEFVEVPGVTAAWERGPFYNARLQMADLQADKLLLVAHAGGDLTVHLRPRPPVLWIVGDVLWDALDDALLYRPQTGGALASMAVGGLALLAVAWRSLRRQGTRERPVPGSEQRSAQVRFLGAALALGLGFAALHGLYAFLRLDQVTMTSKAVVFQPLALVGTFLLASAGAALFVRAGSWRGRMVAVGLASFGAWAPAAFSLGVLAASNLLVFQPRLGLALYTYALGLLPLLAFGVEALLFALAFLLLVRARGGLCPAGLGDQQSQSRTT